jgi:spoIIIJ-associated protein
VDTKPDEKADIEEQAQVAKEFAKGLLDAFGLEGDVVTRVEDDVLYVDIEGDQTEALVGRKGAVVQAVHELTRTVIQRKTFGAPRMRVDIAGYAARRREALKIYAQRLAESVKEDGREAMLEPMNAADRKVVHDAIAEVEGVRSYSEGEDPNRSVIVAPAD